MKQIFSLNHSLSTISIEIEFKWEDDTCLDGICLPKVTSLCYETNEENSALIAALIKMCPKIKKLAFRSDKEAIDVEAVNTLVYLESLTIDTEGKSMQHIICAGRLIHFSFMNNGFDEDTKIFFSHHQSIEHLIIYHKPYELHMIVSHLLCKHIVNYLPNLHSFEYDELEDPFESLQEILTLKNLRSLKSKPIVWINQQVNDLCISAGIVIKLR